MSALDRKWVSELFEWLSVLSGLVGIAVMAGILAALALGPSTLMFWALFF